MDNWRIFGKTSVLRGQLELEFCSIGKVITRFFTLFFSFLQRDFSAAASRKGSTLTFKTTKGELQEDRISDGCVSLCEVTIMLALASLCRATECECACHRYLCTLAEGARCDHSLPIGKNFDSQHVTAAGIERD